MNLLVSLLVAFPLGFLVPSRVVAHLTYVALYLFLFVSTAVALLIEWAGGSDQAFGPYPDGDGGQIASFVLISGVAFLAGAGLVHWGAAVRGRRTSRRALGVDVAVS